MLPVKTTQNVSEAYVTAGELVNRSDASAESMLHRLGESGLGAGTAAADFNFKALQNML